MKAITLVGIEDAIAVALAHVSVMPILTMLLVEKVKDSLARRVARRLTSRSKIYQ
jgi:hypothetical protein